MFSKCAIPSACAFTGVNGPSAADRFFHRGRPFFPPRKAVFSSREPRIYWSKRAVGRKAALAPLPRLQAPRSLPSANAQAPRPPGVLAQAPGGPGAAFQALGAQAFGLSPGPGALAQTSRWSQAPRPPGVLAQASGTEASGWLQPPMRPGHLACLSTPQAALAPLPKLQALRLLPSG